MWCIGSFVIKDLVYKAKAKAKAKDMKMFQGHDQNQDFSLKAKTKDMKNFQG